MASSTAGNMASQCPRKNRNNIFIYSKLQCEVGNGSLEGSLREKSLAIDFACGIQFRVITVMCTVYKRWRFSISRYVRSHGTPWILFFDAFVRHIPSGRRRNVFRQQGRFSQVTTTGKEVFAYRREHAKDNTKGSRQVFNHRNWRDPCQKEIWF